MKNLNVLIIFFAFGTFEAAALDINGLDEITMQLVEPDAINKNEIQQIIIIPTPILHEARELDKKPVGDLQRRAKSNINTGVKPNSAKAK